MNLENIKEILDCYFSEEKANFDDLHKDNLIKEIGQDELSNDTFGALEQIKRLSSTTTFGTFKQGNTIHEPTEHILFNLLKLKLEYEQEVEKEVQYKMNLGDNSKLHESHL